MAKKINLICVGKLKNKHILELEQEYIKRLNSIKLNIIETKAHAEDINKEMIMLIRKLQELNIKNFYLLDEQGENFSSHQFANFIGRKLDSGPQITFIIGGAYGHDPMLKKQSSGLISLSSMTFPHKLARLFLVEQIYRAQCLIKGHPYHNE